MRATAELDISVLEQFAETGTNDATVRNPFAPRRRIRAVLFDVDGTLYLQRPLRRLMAAELARAALAHPLQAPALWRGLSAYRYAQERLRGHADANAARQLALAASTCGMDATKLGAIVDEWMNDRPLKHLMQCRAEGLVDLLEFLDAKRVRLGILSDYPAQRKIDALGIGHYFSLVLCGGDPEIGAFKPSPRGFLAACAQWQLAPSDVLYIGDRADADAAGAAAARMPAVLVTQAQIRPSIGTLAVSSFERLRDVLDDNHSR